MGSARAQSSSDVRFEGGRLTIHAANEPLSEILKAVARLTNLEVIGQDGVTGSVSPSIEAMPLREALDTLLTGFNFVLSTKPAAEDQPPRYVLSIVPRQGAPRVPAPPANNRIAVPALDAVRLAEQQLADPYLDPDADPDVLAEADADAREREAELTEREAAGAFGPDVPFTDLLLDVEDGNPLVRHRVLAELHSRDPRAAFPHVMDGLADDDPGVGDLAVEILGRMTDSESLKRVGELLTKSTDTAVRVRAFMVLAARAEPSSTQYVKAVLNDENQIMREATAQFLAEMEKPRRVALLPCGLRRRQRGFRGGNGQPGRPVVLLELRCDLGASCRPGPMDPLRDDWQCLRLLQRYFDGRLTCLRRGRPRTV